MTEPNAATVAGFKVAAAATFEQLPLISAEAQKAEATSAFHAVPLKSAEPVEKALPLDPPKRCPLCAGRAQLAPMPAAPSWFRVQCLDMHCGCTTWAMQTEEDAIAAWNRRPLDGTQ